jgi:thiol:disulfide interchange protein
MTFYAPDPFDFKEIAKGPLIAAGETFYDSYKGFTQKDKYRLTYFQAQEKGVPAVPSTSKATTTKATDTASSTAATEAAKIEADNLKKQKAILASSQSSDDNGLLATRKTTV